MTPSVPDRRKSSLTLAHELGITELGIALDRLDAAGVIDLVHWETARESIAISVGVVTRDGFEQVPLVADAYVVLRRGNETHAFLVEVDRGTVATARMRKKFLGYLAWQRLDGPMSRFGVKALRVLTICATPARLERLRSAARDVTSGGGTGFLWFGLAHDVRADDPATLLGPIWRIVREEPAPQPLFRDEPAAPAAELDQLGAIDDVDVPELEARLVGVLDREDAGGYDERRDDGPVDLPTAA